MQGGDGILDWIKKTGLSNIVWTADLDKTLLDVSADPNKAAPAAGLEESARALEAQTAGFFIITGRDVEFVDREVFPNSRVRISAEYHNMVRFEPNGKTQDLSPRPQWGVVDADMDTLVAGTPGLHLRKKPFMRSLHYSSVPADQRPAVKAMLHDALGGLLEVLHARTGQKIDLTDGGLIFDMGPAGQDKGVALNDIMAHALGRHPDRKLLPIYFGDSPGDIPAALAARAQGGVFVAVGDDPRVLAVADFALKDPTECRALFKKVSGLTAKPFCAPQPPQL